MLNDFYLNLDPVAFSIGPLAVRWYGLAYIFGFLLGGILLARVAKRWKIDIDYDSVLTIVMCGMVGVIVGARLGYCFFYGASYYIQHPVEMLLLNHGGMSFHGGMIGLLLSAIVSSRMTGVPYLTLADLGSIVAPVGLFLGRCANFVNGELWGAPTDLPWGVVFGGAAGDIPRHPSQLYEALLEGLLILIVLYALSRKVPPRPRGTFLGVFLVMYGICRILMEFVRQPDSQLGYLAAGWLTMGQVLSFPLILIGIGLLVWAARTKLPQVGRPVDSE